MVWTSKKGRRQFSKGSGGSKDWWQTASRKAQEKVGSMFDRGYDYLENRGTHDTRSPVVEGSDHPSNPTVNGKLGMLNDDGGGGDGGGGGGDGDDGGGDGCGDGGGGDGGGGDGGGGGGGDGGDGGGVRWQNGRCSMEVRDMCGVEDLSVELRQRR